MPFSQINGKTIFYSWKPASRAGLTLYFIHGLGSAHSFWSPIIPGLVEAGFSCLAIDVPGFGQSPYHGKPHSLHEITEDCITLLESLGKSLDRTIIIGASMAGIVCCEIAVKHQVAGVVSVGPICPGPDTKEAFEHRVAVIKKGKRAEHNKPQGSWRPCSLGDRAIADSIVSPAYRWPRRNRQLGRHPDPGNGLQSHQDSRGVRAVADPVVQCRGIHVPGPSHRRRPGARVQQDQGAAAVRGRAGGPSRAARGLGADRRRMGRALQDGARGAVRCRPLAQHRGRGRDGGVPEEVCEKGHGSRRKRRRVNFVYGPLRRRGQHGQRLGYGTCEGCHSMTATSSNSPCMAYAHSKISPCFFHGNSPRPHLSRQPHGFVQGRDRSGHECLCCMAGRM